MKKSELIDEIAARAGLTGNDEAEAVGRVVLEALAERLSRTEAAALAEELPPDLATLMAEGPQVGELDRDALVASVARREPVGASFAYEHLVSVCRALAALLPPATLTQLRRSLPPDAGELFVLPEPAGDPPPVLRRSTLAEGRPGSRRPLSEGRAAQAQSDSVGEENPHGRTKLSTAAGLTQEREHESLASWQPRRRR